MRRHEIYHSIVRAVENNKLIEPFTANDFRRICSNFGEGTYRAFLWKHRVGNQGSMSELFIREAPGKFRLVRPFKYGL